jgi:DedD protein
VIFNLLWKKWFIFFPLLMVVGCALMEEAPKKSVPFGLIATPASYYSTPKARYLGGKYKENLDRLVERIVRSQKTANLQFANNIASVGGIGFFTHSATRTADERYLEVVLGAPETFEAKGDYSVKVHRLFSLYGTELLAILSSDSQIYQEKEVSGYGLNLSWRNITPDPSGPRVAMERAVVYFPKDKVRGFLRHEIDQNKFLGEAVIFAIEENGPMNLLSYRPQELKPDFRPEIREENLAVAKADAKPEPKRSPSKPITAVDEALESKTGVDNLHDEQTKSKEKPAPSPTQPRPAEKKEEIHASAPLPDKTMSTIIEPAPNTVPPKHDKAEEQKVSEPVKADRSSDAKAQSEKASENKPQVIPAVPAVTAKAQDQPARQKPERSADTPAERRKGSTGSDSIPPKSDERAVEPSKTADLAPEKLASPKAARPIVQKPVEKHPEPAAQPQKAMEGKTLVTPGQATTTTKAADGAPVATRAGELKAPETTVEPVAKSPKSVESKAPIPRKQDQPQELKVSEPVKADRSSDAKAQSEKPSENKPEVIPAVPAVTAKPQDKPAPPKPELSNDTSAERRGGSAGLNRVPTKSTEEKVEPSQTASVFSEKPTTAKVAQPSERKPPEQATEPVVQLQKNVEAKTDVAPGRPTTTPKAADVASAKTEKVSKAEPAKAPVQPAEAKRLEPATAGSKVEVKTSDVKSVEQPLAREQSRPVEEKKSEAGAAPAKLEARIPGPTNSAPTAPASSHQEKVSEKSTPEQVALLKRPIESFPDKKPLVPPAAKALEGFIIQVAFSDRGAAQSWAEAMGRRGHAVSVTEAGRAGPLRVRIGNFAMRDEAERQLRTLREQGLSGIIINLPQAYRPDVRPSEAEAGGKPLSGAQ